MRPRCSRAGAQRFVTAAGSGTDRRGMSSASHSAARRARSTTVGSGNGWQSSLNTSKRWSPR
jgi:hypothetical protein